jgi:NAD(P)-dependent dehydrogenase (short-subunit alcohol dehydrogenase family)
VALVTGASRGIGKGIALALGRQGAVVAVSYHTTRAAAEQTVQAVQAAGGRAFSLATDVTDPERAGQAIRAVGERLGRLDILVNNVGNFGWKSVAESSTQEWHDVLASNLFSVFYTSRAALPLMRAQHWGRIINLGSVGAERAFGQAKISAFLAAKAGMVAFSRSLALEEARNGITVNVVNPSIHDNSELTVEEAARVRDARFPVGRPPTSEDVAAAVLYFASEQAGYVTGQVLNVSGGWLL